ncbi:MAG: histone deacetylase [Steroidobacterales bacterium]
MQTLSRIPVVFSDAAVAETDSFSPSAGKPRAVVAAWQALDLPIELQSIVPVTVEELHAAHDPKFVDNILSCRTENGFGNRSADVARSLPFTNGALLCAARAALAGGIACAPVSGFHHANHASAGGFCTFNGLMVTAVRLLADRKLRRILILDCDMHYGNGTDDIIGKLKLESTVENLTFGRWYATPAQGQRYLEHLEREARRLQDFDLVLYQAGADVHVDDALGGVLTTEQMRRREEIVFGAARAAGVPLAWNLAGGYQQPLTKVIDLHVQTMRECARVYRAVPAR